MEARLRSEPEDTEDGSTRVPGGQAGARAVLIGAGDLAQCGLEGVVQTGLLMDKLLRQESDPTLVTFGDNSNDNGSRQRYECFDRWWGRFRSSIWPSPGNHDYETDPASPYYYEYFPHAGTPGRGYYSYDRGSWHIVVLNSELAEASRPAQIVWLETDLRTHPSECTLAYFHRPYLSSGEFAAFRMKRVWDVLYRYGVDVVANGHEHFYAAFPPMAPDGTRDGRFGIRQIIAGTGGARLFAAPVPAYGERIVSQSWGLLKLTLESDRYAWDFVSVNEAVLDHGEDRCHGRPPAGIAF
ncbi:MAG: metallophosphoesterase [Acidobacteria bacterium]|nr:metallophosphoesterase [Acidobacteriota bacterium]